MSSFSISVMVNTVSCFRIVIVVCRPSFVGTLYRGSAASVGAFSMIVFAAPVLP